MWMCSTCKSVSPKSLGKDKLSPSLLTLDYPLLYEPRGARGPYVAW